MQQTPLRIRDLTIPHRLILAPMCGITLLPFRKLCKDYGAGLVFNQMVSAKALSMRDEKSFRIMSFDRKQESPVGLQVFGNNAETLGEAARIMQDTGPDIIDLNLGCPAKKIVNDGGGSALMSEPKKLQKILKEMRQALTIPFSIKIRAGWDEKSKNAIEIARMAEGEGVDAIALHARTRAQGYSGKSDWSFIKELKAAVSVPVIGNGDVKTAEDAHRMIKETGCDAVMTGRGAFEQPWIFQNFQTDAQWSPSTQGLKEMILKQYNYFREFFGDVHGIKMMRKFLCAYSKGRRDGASFRNRMVHITEWPQIKAEIDGFFGGH